jgi:hypothetical protein
MPGLFHKIHPKISFSDACSNETSFSGVNVPFFKMKWSGLLKAKYNACRSGRRATH